MSRRLKILVPLLAASVLLCLPALGHAATFSWHKALRIESARDGGLTAVSCPDAKLCVAGDSAGQILFSTKPAAITAGAWSGGARVDAPRAITGISCPTVTFCAVVDNGGALVTSTHPTGGARYWSHPVRIDTTTGAGGGYAGLAAISCPSATLCVAVDDADPANVVYSTDPAGPKSAWHTVALSGPATSVSCSSTTLCVIGGTQRYVSVDPAVPTDWKGSGTDTSDLYSAVDCVFTGTCVAVGYGNATAGLASASSTPSSTWSALDSIEANPPATGDGLIDAVGCTRGSCVALDGFDNAYISSTPTTGVWGAGAPIRPKSASQWNAISCTSGLCVVVDSAGMETSGTI